MPNVQSQRIGNIEFLCHITTLHPWYCTHFFDLADTYSYQYIFQIKKESFDPVVVRDSHFTELCAGTRKMFRIDGRWYEMEYMQTLYLKYQENECPPCSIRIPGVGGSYELPVVGMQFTMIYGGKYCLFQVHGEFSSRNQTQVCLPVPLLFCYYVH